MAAKKTTAAAPAVTPTEVKPPLTVVAPAAPTGKRTETTITADVDTAAGAITFTFYGGAQHTIKLAELSEELRIMAGLHGLKQKVVDAGAKGVDPVTGKSMSHADKNAASLEVIERLKSADGTWNKTRATGASSGGDAVRMLCTALARVFPKDSMEHITARVAAFSKVEREAVAATPRVAAAVAAIMAERAAIMSERAALSMVDGGALLAGFGGEA